MDDKTKDEVKVEEEISSFVVNLIKTLKIRFVVVAEGWN